MWKNGSTATSVSSVAHLGGAQRLGHVGDEVAMGQHHALGDAGGAGGVRQHDGVVGVDRHLLGERRTHQVGERAGPLGFADDEDLLDGGALGGRSGDVEERRDRDEQPGVRVDELVVDLALDVRRVDRRDDPAGVRDAVEDDGVLRDVRGEQGQRLAGLEAARHQAAGQRAHALEEAAVRQRASARAVDEGRLVAELLGSREHVVGQGEVGDLDLGQRAGVDHAHSSVGTCPETCPEPTDRSPLRHPCLGCETRRR